MNEGPYMKIQIYWHISTKVMFVFIFSTRYHYVQNCLLQEWNKLKKLNFANTILLILKCTFGKI